MNFQVMGYIHTYNTISLACILHLCPGDFHFVWECVRSLLSCYWGKASTPGSLHHLREILRRHQVDQKGSVSDEFVQHCSRAHLLANICRNFNVFSPTDPIPHENTQEWLITTAQCILQSSIMPTESEDPIYAMHRSFLTIQLFKYTSHKFYEKNTRRFNC